jgi:succinate dehydrogenase cytochrome b subunit
MPTRSRPTSPHVWLYRWQIGNTLSILHRFTGAALAVGLIALSYWFVSLAGWTFSFLFHLLNGVRHLFWDAGKGFERTQRHLSGWFAVLGAIALTLCVAAWVWPRLS